MQGVSDANAIDRVVAGEALLLRLPVYMMGGGRLVEGGVPLVMYPRGDPCIK